jgi:hypothetical protein
MCMYNVALGRVRVTIFATEPAINIIYYERESVALVIQHATRIRRTILSSVSYPAPPHFSTVFRKRQDFRKIFTEYT